MKIIKIESSKDLITRKYVQVTDDNHQIETTFVDYYNKYIICFSTQIGCNLGCKFCYNGLKHNFIRNLTTKEIIEQIENVISNESIKEKQLLFSAMGIGEPLLNYDNLISAFNYLNQKYPNSKFALATTGVNPKKILDLIKGTKELYDFKLTISLHSASEEIRESLMPSTNNLNELVQTVKEYICLSNRKVEWNYVLFDGINDSQKDAKNLVDLLGADAYIKLNKYNKVLESSLSVSKNKDIFIKELEKYNTKYEYYETNGEDINAACGQMISE